MAGAAHQVGAVLAGEQVAPVLVGEHALRPVDVLQRVQKCLQGGPPAGLVGRARLFQLKRHQAGDGSFRIGIIAVHAKRGNERRPDHRNGQRAPEPQQDLGEERFHSARRVLRRAAELVAHAANGLDERIAGLQLLAQMADVHVDGAIERRGLAVVEILHQGVARKHASGGAHQHFQNVELEGGQLHALAGGEDLAGAGVERDAVDFQARIGRGRTRFIAAQDGADARGQFARIEGLGQVVVGAQFQAHDAVHILAARGQHDDRDLALSAQPAENLEAVDARQHDVQHHQVDARFQSLRQAAIAFVLAAHREALPLQKLPQKGAEFGIVIHQ